MTEQNKKRAWPEISEEYFPFTFGEMRKCYVKMMRGEEMTAREIQLAELRHAATISGLRLL